MENIKYEKTRSYVNITLGTYAVGDSRCSKVLGNV